MVKILALAGSTRKDSCNKKLLQMAVDGARKAGAEVTVIDLADYPMPLYDGDLEEKSGIPENGKKLKKLFIEHDGFLFACPEYNSSVSAVWKNAIDWVSRPEPNEEFLIAFKGKTAAIMSASPGDLGGLRGLVTVRSILGNIFVTVIPDTISISDAYNAFDSEGKLTDPKKTKRAENIGQQLAQIIKKLKG